MRCLRYVCFVVLIADTLSAASRITFERTVAARQSLAGAEDLVITYAVGDNSKISTFIDAFVEQANRADTLRVVDATRLEHSNEKSRKWKRAPKYVERTYAADAFLRVDAFRCSTTDRSGEGRVRDADGIRLLRKHAWVDASCEAHIHAVSKDAKTKLAEFSARGEGTSPRVVEITEEERNIAIDQAARYAAVVAAEEITPRRVRETIALIEDAPEFYQGMPMIESDRVAEARKIWERALATNRNSAALRFNLAAICEALGDFKAADEHYGAAEKLAPSESRYKYEHEMFRRRNGWKK